MNDLIREYMLLAGTDTSGKWMSVDNAEKFAELIVRQCALTAGLMEHDGRKNIGAQILDNFGIENER
jgi:coenzyme F420-reducing hydrogenase delta subunit